MSEMGSPAVAAPHLNRQKRLRHRTDAGQRKRGNANTQWTNASCLFPFAGDGGDTVCTLLSLYCTYTQDRTDAGTTTTLQITTQHTAQTTDYILIDA